MSYLTEFLSLRLVEEVGAIVGIICVAHLRLGAQND